MRAAPGFVRNGLAIQLPLRGATRELVAVRSRVARTWIGCPAGGRNREGDRGEEKRDPPAHENAIGETRLSLDCERASAWQRVDRASPLKTAEAPRRYTRDP